MSAQPPPFPTDDTAALARFYAPCRDSYERLAPQILRLGYDDGIHGQEHIRRVLLYILFYLHHAEHTLSSQDADILCAYALLHDIGRVDDGVDDAHGFRALHHIRAESLPSFSLSPAAWKQLELLIAYHCLPDSQGHAAIDAMEELDAAAKERLHHLYRIAKDADGLDRVRIFDLDIDQLRLDFFKRLTNLAEYLLRHDLPEDDA